MPRSPVFWFRTTIIVILIALLSQVTSIYLPVILSLVLVFMLNPIVERCCRIPCLFGRGELPRSVGILLAFILTGVGFFAIAAFIFLPFIREFNEFVVDLPRLLKKVQILMIGLQQQASLIEIPDNVRDLVNQGIAKATAFSVDLAQRIVNAVFSFASQVVELVVVPVLSYYLLKDWRSLHSGFINAFSPSVRNHLRSVLGDMGSVISGYIQGQLIISLIMGVLVFIGMVAMGVSYPLVLGLLAALTETIPVVGPVIGAVPAIVLAFLISPELAVKVILFYIVIQQVENHLIVPKIMGHSIDLHPILVVVSLLIGASLYGVVGMIVAVPVAALLQVLTRHLWYYNER